VAYPSIYRAKAVQYDGTTLIAYVPQVFGDVTIEITDLIGEIEQGMGWVFFQAGNPEFPVWMSGVFAGAAFEGGGEVDEGGTVFITRDYRWLNNVTATDPGSGRVKVNNLDPALATEVYISAYDQNATAYLTLLSLTPGDLFAVYLQGNVGTRIEYKLAGPAVNNTGWLTIPVTVGANYGFASGTPGNNAQVKVTVQTTGSVIAPNEVWISPNEPTDPNVELWYDTDEYIPTSRQVVEPKGTITSYTVQLADENKVLWFTSSTAIALTIPTFATTAFGDGVRIDILQTGAGRITVSGAGGVSVIATPTAVLRATGSVASLLKLSTNTWLVTGDMG
jgi:hypothetical protein